MKLVPKVVSICVIIAIAIIGGTSLVIYQTLKGELHDTIDASLRTDISFLTSKITDAQQQAVRITQAISQDHLIRQTLLEEAQGNPMSIDAISTVLRAQLNIYPQINYIIVIRRDGSTFTTSDLSPYQEGLSLNINESIIPTHPLIIRPRNKNISIGNINTDPFLSAQARAKNNSSQWFVSSVLNRSRVIGRIIVSLNWQKAYGSVLEHALVEVGEFKPALIGVAIRDNQNHNLLSRFRRTANEDKVLYNDTIFYEERANFLWSQKKINIGKSVLRATLIFDRELTLRSLQQLKIAIAIIAIIGAALISFLLYTILTKLLLDRISDIHEGMLNIGEGNLNYRFGDLANDEIGDLGRNLNTMIQQLNKNTTSIDTLNNEIELKNKAFEEIQHQEEQLAQTRKHIDKITHEAPSLLSYIDSSEHFVFVNKTHERWFDYPQEDTQGQHIRHLVGDTAYTLLFPHIQNTLKGNITEFESAIPFLRGGTRYIRATLTPDMDTKNHVQGFFVSIEDITRSKKFESRLREDANILKQQKKELELSRERAEASVKAKNEFLASMSHEIRTPMNGVFGMLGLIMRGELNKKQQHYAHLAHSNAESLLNLINDILDFSKIDAGKIELEILDFDPRVLLGDLLESQALKAQEKGLELVLDTHNLPAVNIKSDPTRIRQILSNLVSNAIKFTESGEIIVNVALNDAAPYLSCSVKDTGTGISTEHIPTLFDSFTQVDASMTRKFGGTGLGLAISNQLCHLLGGKNIEVTSTLGMGSEFSFSIPVKTPQIKNPELLDPDLKNTTILILEPHQRSAKAISEQLDKWGADVILSHEADFCLRSITAEDMKVNFVLINEALAQFNATEFINALKKSKAETIPHFVIMAPINSPHTPEHYRDLGFSFSFSKPATPLDLIKSLRLDQEDSQQAHTDTNNQTEDDKVESRRILVVDDNTVNQQIAHDLLEDLGHSIELAANGYEAIERLSASPVPFQLILMDCQMPEMDGFTATQKIREGAAGKQYCHTPIVALTANAMKGDRERCFQSGMSDYLPKPIDFEKLSQCIVRWTYGDSCVRPANEAEFDTALESKGEQKTAPPENGKNLPKWDEKALLNRVRNKPERVTKLIRTFLTTIRLSYAELDSAIQENNLQIILSCAHSIKGASGNISAMRLQNCAAQIEFCVKEGNATDSLETLWNDFVRHYLALIDILETHTAA